MEAMGKHKNSKNLGQKTRENLKTKKHPFGHRCAWKPWAQVEKKKIKT